MPAVRPLFVRLMTRAVEVRPDERRAVLASFAYFFCLLASYSSLRPLREEMGVVGGVERLPWLFSATFVAVLLLSPVWAALAGRVPRRRLLPAVYRFFALNLLVLFVLVRAPGLRATIAPVFFVWLSVFNLYAVAVFWSFMADVFRPEQGRRLFGFIAAGGSAGAVVGPLLTTSLVGLIGGDLLMLVAAGLLEVTAQCARLVGVASSAISVSPAADASPAPPSGDEPVGGRVWSGLRTVVTSPYLRAAASYLILVTLTGTTTYFLFTRGVAANVSDPVARTRLFANVDLGANVLALLLQGFAAGQILRRSSVAATLAILPVASGLGLLGASLAPTVIGLALAHTLRRGVAYGLATPAQAALFTVVSREDKYKAKAFIDTAIFRGGDVLGGWIFTAMLSARLPAALLAAAASLPWVLLALYLGRAYARRLSPGLSPAR
jgi:AAA family ATP:ADP antiporter